MTGLAPVCGMKFVFILSSLNVFIQNFSSSTSESTTYLPLRVQRLIM